MSANYTKCLIVRVCIATLASWNISSKDASASGLDFFDDFQGEELLMPDGSRKLYPNPKSWGYTFSPGLKWPDSYGDGTNFLAANGECQIYLHPFIGKIDGKALPITGRFDPFNVTKDGLAISARPLSQEQRAMYKAKSFQSFGSGILITKFAFKYGEIKVVARLPSTVGSWPAIWMLAKNNIWPPEMDILEGMPWGKHRTQVHSGFIGKDNEKMLSFGDWFETNTDVSGSFHAYELVWNETNITMKLDGRVVWSKHTPPSMHQEMYLIINFAVGGKWPYNELGINPIDGTDDKRLTDGSKSIIKEFPAEFVIKSVRIHSIR